MVSDVSFFSLFDDIDPEDEAFWEGGVGCCGASVSCVGRMSATGVAMVYDVFGFRRERVGQDIGEEVFSLVDPFQGDSLAKRSEGVVRLAGMCRRQVWCFGVELDEGVEERGAETHPDIILIGHCIIEALIRKLLP